MSFYTLIAAMTLSVGGNCAEAGDLAVGAGYSRASAIGTCNAMALESSATAAMSDDGYARASRDADACPSDTAWAEQTPRGWEAVCGDDLGRELYRPRQVRRVALEQGGRPGARTVLVWEASEDDLGSDE